MERRELYEPEDIEQLLMERAYDDLLEEERAFVLRHLTGRAEYEAMRGLLLRVHEDDRPTEEMDADPAIRTHVLEAFRAQQQPQWRIWLNSVQVFLFPKEVSGLWRPALAFGSVAIVVTMLTVGSQRLNEATSTQVAEVKTLPQEPATASDKPIPPPPALPEAQPTDVVEEATTNELAQPELAAATTRQQAKDQPDATMDVPFAGAAAVAEESVPAPMASEDVADALFDMEADGKSPTHKGIVVLPSAADTTIPVGALTHTVTPTEFFANATIASTPTSLSEVSVKGFLERDKKSKPKKVDAALSDADDATAMASAQVDPLLGLLRAAW